MPRSACAGKLGRDKSTIATFAPATVVYATTAAAADTGTPMMPRSTVHVAIAEWTGARSVAGLHVPTGTGAGGTPGGASPPPTHSPPAVVNQKPLWHLLPSIMVAKAHGRHIFRLLYLARVAKTPLRLIATSISRARCHHDGRIGASAGHGAVADTSPTWEPARPQGPSLPVAARNALPMIGTDKGHRGGQLLCQWNRRQCAGGRPGGGGNARAWQAK